MAIRMDIFNYFKSIGFKAKMYDESGSASVLTPDESEYMYFEQDTTSYMVVFDETGTYKHLYVYKAVSDNEFREILVTMKKIANRAGYSVTVKNFARKIRPKEFSYIARERESNETVKESFAVKGFKKTSHFTKENARVIVKHRDYIDETKQYPNSRKIKEIFVETKQGEKRKVPYGNLTLGKAIATYINYGGTLYDPIVDQLVSVGQDIGGIGGLEFSESCSKETRREIAQNLREAKKQINKFIGTLAMKKRKAENIPLDVAEMAFSEAFYSEYLTEESAKKAARIQVIASKLKS